MTRILVVDNFDSFVYTLAGYLQELGAEVEVVRNDHVDASAISQWDAVLLSPGPGAPADAGVSIPMVHAAIETGTPLLGVCLGHQAIAEALGGVVTHAPELMHGKTSRVEHDGTSVFAGLPSPLTATRYHSLAVVDGTMPDALRVTARTVPDASSHAGGAAHDSAAHGTSRQDAMGQDAATPGTPVQGAPAPGTPVQDAPAQDTPAHNTPALGVIMAIEHRDAPVWGVQFHPESVLTEGGYRMLGNWLEAAGLAGAAERAAGRAPLVMLAPPPGHIG